VNGEQMSARQPLTSVAYAFQADAATTATTATNFSGALTGDVTGTQGATAVSAVGGPTGVSSTQIIAGVNSANNATSSNTFNMLVKRDASGNFAANMITINGTPANVTDAATKGYVDTQVISSAISSKSPAVVVSTVNTIINGMVIIDGISLTAGDRVLLTGQTTLAENGLWIVQVGSWTRPLDFSAGSSAGRASVLITSGDTFAGTGFSCSTPNAIVNTDPISFAQSSAASQTIAANVGTGAGQVYRDKTGTTINLKTIAAGSHVGVVNNANDITLSTDATSGNIPGAIVSRDASGNFSAGSITANVFGNTMTATALAANGTNCPAGQYPLGVDASGNAEGCTAAGGSATIVYSGGTSNAKTGVNYCSANGQSLPNIYSDSAMNVVPITCTARNLYVSLYHWQAGDSGSYIVTLMLGTNGIQSAQTLTCTVANSGAVDSVTKCSDTSHTVSISAGSYISIKIDGSSASYSGSNGPEMAWGFICQ
jgi:hypothetical protein